MSARRPSKDSPQRPPDLGPALTENLLRALDDDRDRRAVSVGLRVSGGPPQKRYRFFLDASGDGRAQCELRCQISDRQGRHTTKSLKPRDFSSVVTAIVRSGVMDLCGEERLFLPDTLVGTLEVRHGDAVCRVRFIADPEQARTEGGEHPAVAKAADAMYRLGGKLLGHTRSVAP